MLILSSQNNMNRFIYFCIMSAGLEFFDFAIYALFATPIAHAFFPQGASWAGLLQTFAVFALGYVARPLGGIIVGHLGDVFGRKRAFTHTVLAMAAATLAIGCLPTYAMLGIGAPLLLLVCRLIQGAAMGGEVSAVVAFALEHIPLEKVGFIQSLSSLSMIVFSALGSLMGYGLNHVLTVAQMGNWGWRLPFVMGFFLGLVGFILRAKAAETPVFLALMESEKKVRVPLLRILSHYKWPVFKAVSLTAFPACFGSFVLFLPSYLVFQHQILPQNTYILTTFCFLTIGAMSVLSGYLSDSYPIRRFFALGAVLTVLGVPIGLWLMFNVSGLVGLSHFYCAMFLLALGPGLIQGVYMLGVIRQFPASLRCSGIGLCQNFGQALMAATAPLIFGLSIHWQGSPFAILNYLFICLGLTLMVGLSLAQSAQSALQRV